MKKSNSIVFDAITIDKKKLDETMSAVLYLILCTVRILLLIATGCFLFLTAVSAGDSRINGETHPFIALGFAIICYLSAKIVGMITVNHLHSTRKRLKRYNQQ